jgi:subtilisin-like proprotein convertase family protein
MKNLRSWLLLAAAAVAFLLAGWRFTPATSGHSAAKVSKTTARADWPLPTLENYDIRAAKGAEEDGALAAYRAQLGAAQGTSKRRAAAQAMAAGRSQLAARVPGLHVEDNPFGTAPEIVGVAAGCHCALTEADSQAHEPLVRAFLTENAALYGLTPAQVAQLNLVADYANPDGNLSWIEYEQRVGGRAVFQGYLRAALTNDGRLVRTSGNLAAGLNYASLPTVAQLPPAEATAAAAKAIGVEINPFNLRINSVAKSGRVTKLAQGPFTEEIKTELVYFPLEPGLAALAYSMVLWQPHDAYYILVDANDGRLLWRKRITNEQTQPVTYSVYNDDSPSPLSPTSALPGAGFQPPFIARTNQTLVSELPAFDNLGWITDGGNVTTGNNVDAGLDVDGTNGIDAAGRATGSPSRVFNFTYDPTVDAPSGTSYRMGAVTNLFFWSNRYHDKLYQLGFNEAARNFQTNNFGRGGTGNDFVRAEVQDSSGTNNANFSTPPDGSLPRMQMYIFPGPNPDRDGDLDGDVFLHELTHGTSNRLHANAAGLATTQSGGMGEGWSDFYARALLSTADEDVNGIYASGGYVTNLLAAGFTDNYYYGIRRFPYAVKTNVGGPAATRPGQPHNPVTFADIDTALFSINDGAYNRNPALNQAQAANEVHAIGEVWCMMLLEVRARIIQRMGWAAGNQRALQLVTDAMKLDPASPTLLQARDSIIAADCAGFAGADEQDIWAGFATRGAGFSASTTGGTTAATDVIESFSVPNLTVGTITFSDAAGNNNGGADPGETVALSVPLNNPFCGTDALNTTANVTGGGNANYGTITHGATGTQSINYTIPANAVCGTTLSIPVVINSSLGQVTRNFSLLVGRITGTTAPTTYANSNVTPIPDLATLDQPITVADAGPVADVNVRVRLNHTFDGDLVISLVAPDNTVVTLVNRRGSSGDNFGSGTNDCAGTFTVFDDAAATAITAGTAPFAGTFRPEGLLSTFNNHEASGTWKVRINDAAANDTGTLGCVQLEITRSQIACTPACSFSAQPANINVNNDANACGALVNFSLPTLSCGGNVTASPQSGSTFPVGTTQVMVTGTPSGGGANITTTFNVTVNDTENPVFTSTPANVFKASTNGTNAVVNFNAPSASDNCPGVTVTSNPPSGSTFPIGTTQVTHTATDAHGRTATTTSNVTVTPPAANGDVLISEFRVDGPNGPSDEYMELYNNTDSAITVATSDGSAGWAVGWSIFCGVCPNDGFTGTYFVIPAGTQIPARHHLLWTNVQTDANNVYHGYSLNNYGGANQGVGDLTFNGFTFSADNNDVTLNGLALFTSANQATWSLANRLDAVGYSNTHDPLFIEGPGNQYLFGDYKTNLQYAFVRKLTTGLPQDTNNNANDFDIVSTSGPFTVTYDLFTVLIPAVLGAPGPENLSSPVQRNAQIKASLIEPQQLSTNPPNRVRDFTAVTNGAQGTLEIRRRFKNSTGQPVTKLRIRIVDVTTLNTPNPGGAQSDLRFLDSANLAVTTSLGNLTLRGTIVETPPAQTLGAGLNSSAVVNLPGSLAPGATTDVRFVLGVQANGRFRFLVNVEALP